MPKIFISYSRADSQFIEKFVPLIRKMYGNDSIWYDNDIHGGVDWWQMILDEIAACELFIYLISNESLESEYCQAELREALRLQKQILPVIVRRLKPTYPGNTAKDLAPILKKLQFVDMSRKFDDANTLTGLYAAINRLLEQIPETKPKPVNQQPTSQPSVIDKQETDSFGWLKSNKWQGISGIVAILALFVAIYFGFTSLNNGSTDEPTPNQVAQITGEATPEITELPTNTATDTLSPILIDTPTNTPSPTLTDTPTNTPSPIPTDIATNTPSPTVTRMATSSNTPVPPATEIPAIVKAYPCEAQVNPYATSSILNVVRQFPNQTAQIVDNVRRSDTVIVLEQSSGADVFYHIQANGRTIGWIAEEHLVLSNQCPN